MEILKSEIENHKSEIKMEASCISYKETGYFSQTVIDYLEDAPALRSFYKYRPDINGFTELLKSKKVIANRDVLNNVLSEQYAKSIQHTKYNSQLVHDNISLLKSENTYTITTGHQLNIFAGPLYFIYKIVTA